MDVNHALRASCSLAVVLALAVTGQMVEASDESSMVVIAADGGGESIAVASSSDDTELVIAHDGSAAEFQASPEAALEPPATGSATLRVAGDSYGEVAAGPVIRDAQVAPASAAQRGSAWAGILNSGPRRPSASAGLRAERRGSQPRSRKPQSAKAPRAAGSGASTEEPVLPSPSYMTDDVQYHVPAASDAGSLLVGAYERSLTAATEAEYSQIVRDCAEAMRQGLDGDNRQFALGLSAWALNRRGQLRADEGQGDIALADFRAALEFDPQCWRALHNRGVTLAQNGQFAEAFDDVTKVIQTNPGFAKAYSNRATLYVQAGDLEKALADYDAALAIDPSMTAALTGQARVRHLTGRLDAALVSFDTAIAQAPASAETICSRGDLLVDLGRYREALEDYARAIDLDPRFQHAYRNGAWLLATCPDDSIRDEQAALSGAQAALECGYGERHAALDTLAAALANAGRFAEAVGTIQQAIEIAPPEAVPAYEARQKLYENGRPFRTHPVAAEEQGVEFVEG